MGIIDIVTIIKGYVTVELMVSIIGLVSVVVQGWIALKLKKMDHKVDIIDQKASEAKEEIKQLKNTNGHEDTLLKMLDEVTRMHKDTEK